MEPETNFQQESTNTEERSGYPLPKKITKTEIQEETLRHKPSHNIKAALFIFASSLLVAFAAHCLIEPNEFTIGGIAGIAIMTSYATNQTVPQSLIIFCLNMPLLILGYFFLKKRFTFLTIANILLQTLWLFILEQTDFPTIKFLDDGTRIFAAVGAGICIGSSVALALKAGGSTGGIDTLAVLVQKKIPAGSIAQMIFWFNTVIIGSSFFVFRKEGADLAVSLLPVLLSLFEAYIESKANDSITNGFQSAVEFRVVTSKPDEMSFALMTNLSRGVTAVPAKGMYSKEGKGLLMCVVSRRQINAFKRIIQQIDPDCFAVLTNVSQVVGLGFHQSGN